MIFHGVGERVAKSLLVSLNLPTISPTTPKRREREVGLALESVANETCNEAIAVVEWRRWTFIHADNTGTCMHVMSNLLWW